MHRLRERRSRRLTGRRGNGTARGVCGPGCSPRDRWPWRSWPGPAGGSGGHARWPGEAAGPRARREGVGAGSGKNWLDSTEATGYRLLLTVLVAAVALGGALGTIGTWEAGLTAGWAAQRRRDVLLGMLLGPMVVAVVAALQGWINPWVFPQGPRRRRWRIVAFRECSGVQRRTGVMGRDPLRRGPQDQPRPLSGC